MQHESRPGVSNLTATTALVIAAVEQAPESIIITDTSGTIAYVNESASRVSGYRREELVGLNVGVLASEGASSDQVKNVLEAIRRGEVWHGHWVNRRKDGRSIRQEATVSPIRDEAGRVVSLVSAERGVTPESELGEQLAEARKQEAVGRIADSVAHDLNNILLSARGSASAALEALAPSHPARSDIEETIRATNSAARLIDKLVVFGRRRKLRPEKLCLNEVIARSLADIRKHAPPGVTFEERLDQGVFGVYGDAELIEQTLRDLCANSIEAMPRGGRLVVSTSNVTVDECFCGRMPWARKGDYALLSVSDDGRGIPAAIRRRVFEPFFTTKESGEGMGLGLFLAYSTVKRHEGFINLTSEEGHGTKVDIYLPRDIGAEKPAAGPGVDIRRKLILLAEDEELVRRIATRVLENAGFDVLVARARRRATCSTQTRIASASPSSISPCRRRAERPFSTRFP
jgi:PAS domain S-box-containing protein